MLRFASCLHGKLLVVKAFQSSGNIRWLELHADRAGSHNVLLCAGSGLGFLLALMDIWLFSLLTKTHNSVGSCGVPCTFVDLWIGISERPGFKARQANRELLLGQV